MADLDLMLRLAVAALVGLAVGFEREWSGHATGPDARFAGIRTFFLLGTIGGIAGVLSTTVPILATVLVGLAGGLTVAAYLVAARRGPESIDGTTETAALLVLGAGILAGRGALAVASALAAVTVLALGEKDAIRRFVARIDAVEMRGALQFAVLALVVLPLLPAGPFGPNGAIQPRLIWMVVLIFSALNFVGYMARKAAGESRGRILTGALGGLVSSTAVAFSFSRASRREDAHPRDLAIGVVAASTVLVPRVVGISLLLDPRFGGRVTLALLPMAVVGVLLALARRDPDGDPPAADLEVRNPLQLSHAMRMALAFQVVLFGMALAQSRFGGLGLMTAAVLAGLTDVDALTLSMARLAETPDMGALAAHGLVTGVLANTAFKATLGAVLGSPSFRRAILPRMLLLGAGGAVGLLW